MPARQAGSRRDERGGRAAAGKIRRTEDFHQALATGSRITAGQMSVYVRRTGGGETRAGFVTARRIGMAVARNRARRRLKEAWRRVGPRTLPGYDIVFLARDGIGEAKMPELVDEMTRALRALEVITP